MAARSWRMNLPKQLQASYRLKTKERFRNQKQIATKEHRAAKPQPDRLVLVLVLEKDGVVTACIRPAPGGEPLWRIFRRPREFVLS